MSSDIRSISYDSGVAVTQSDATNDTNGPFAGFYVGSVSGGSTIKVTTLRGDNLTLTGLLAGIIYPIEILRVWSSTTTVSSVIGLRSCGNVL